MLQSYVQSFTISRTFTQAAIETYTAFPTVLYPLNTFTSNSNNTMNKYTLALGIRLLTYGGGAGENIDRYALM